MRTYSRVKYTVLLLVTLGAFFSSQATCAQSNFVIKDEAALKAFGESQSSGVSSKALSIGGRPINLDLSQENPVFRQVTDYFHQNSGSIAQDQIGTIRQNGGFQVVGGMNNIGISYSKGFGSFSVNLRRDVAPDLFSDTRWIATDQFDIYISASKLLGDLRDEQIIDITDQQMGLFAGITFKRSYTYVHYADSYEHAVAFNLDKLFFSFLNFRSKNFLQIEKGELLKKEDSLSYAVGGAANAPITAGVGAHVAALVKYDSLSYVTLQGVADDEVAYEGEWLRVASEKSSKFTAEVGAGVVADFLGILQVSLLKYDFSYSLKQSYKFALSFKKDDRQLLADQTPVAAAVASILKHKSVDEGIIAPYLVSEEQRKELAKDSRYELLLFGGRKKAKTTQYKIKKGDTLFSFFSHNFEAASYRQNIASKLFGIIIKSFLKLSTIINNSEERSRSVNIQYRDSRNLIKSQEDLIVDEQSNQESISINFIRNYYAFKGSKGNRKELVGLLENFSGADPRVIDSVEAGLLDKSLTFYSKYSMTQDGVEFFNHLDVKTAYDIFDRMCSDSRPKGFLGWLSSLFSRCESSLKKEFDLYQVEWNTKKLTSSVYHSCEADMSQYRRAHGWMSSRKKRAFMARCTQELSRKSPEERDRELPVWRLAKFMNRFLGKSESKVYYFQIFGLPNVHVYGQVSGTTGQGTPFVNYFHEGNFKGIDLVSNFEVKNGVKTSLEVQ